MPHLTPVNAFHGKSFLLRLLFHSFHLRIQVDASLWNDDLGFGDSVRGDVVARRTADLIYEGTGFSEDADAERRITAS